MFHLKSNESTTKLMNDLMQGITRLCILKHKNEKKLIHILTKLEQPKIGTLEYAKQLELMVYTWFLQWQIFK